MSQSAAKAGSAEAPSAVSNCGGKKHVSSCAFPFGFERSPGAPLVVSVQYPAVRSAVAQAAPLFRLYFMIEPWRPCGRAPACRRRPRARCALASTASICGMVLGGQRDARRWRGSTRDASRLRAPTMTPATAGPRQHRRRWPPSRCRRRAGRRSARSVRSSAWNRSQPPKSSMISLYLMSERFSSASAGSGCAEPALAEEAAGDRAVAEQRDAVALRRRATMRSGRPRVEQRILHLHRGQRHAAVDHAPACGRCRNWWR